MIFGLLSGALSYSDCCDPNPYYGHCTNQIVMQTCKTSGMTRFVLKADSGNGRIRPMTLDLKCPDCGHPGYSMTNDKKGTSTYYHSCDGSGGSRPLPIEKTDEC